MCTFSVLFIKGFLTTHPPSRLSGASRSYWLVVVDDGPLGGKFLTVGAAECNPEVCPSPPLMDPLQLAPSVSAIH